MTDVVETEAGSGRRFTRPASEPAAFTQAGGHPDALTVALTFDDEQLAGHGLVPTRDVKDMQIELPPGMIANPQAAPRCPRGQAAELAAQPCPADTQVGTFAIDVFDKVEVGPIYNLAPEAGQAAELGLRTSIGLTLLMSGRLVRAPDGYSLAVLALGVPLAGVTSVEMTLWGVPAAAGHDAARGETCTGEGEGATGGGEGWRCQGGGEPAGVRPVPFLTMPSDCTAGSQDARLRADAWEEPGRYVEASDALPAPTGCQALAFGSELLVRPATVLPDAPLGLEIGVRTPQSEGAEALATPPLREATVALPQGVSLSPALGAGVSACPASGPEGIDLPSGLDASGRPLPPDQAGEGEEIGPDGLSRLAAGHCPASATIGSAQASSPLLAGELEGRVYLALPLCGGAGQPPCTPADAAEGRLFRMYVELQGGGGLIVKLAGQVLADPATGQLAVRLPEVAQLPLSDLTVSLDAGPRAPLDSPAGCGRVTTSAELTPWSAPGLTPEGPLAAGTPSASSFSAYEVTGCASPPSLAPGFTAGTALPVAGAFSPLSLTVVRQDGEQYLAGIQARAPAGLLGMLASVPPCQARAAAAECPSTALIGTATVAAGAGPAPLEMTGSVYLTGPYEGSPFGLVLVMPANVGPFDLGRLVIRARIDVDAHTGALTITSDRLPQMLDGIPLRVRRVTVDLDRPGFVLNPTDCSAKRVEATVTGSLGAIAHVFSPFAVTGCQALPFKPALSASAGGRASAEGDGAGLDVKLAFPREGESAHVARIAIRLPRQLAPRLPTLQRACEEEVFAADPAFCPEASVVGIARARTPVLPGRPAGPIYLVAHGAKALPSLVVVLQGDGVRLDLEGSTAIGRNGATTISFDHLPDMPLLSFEAYLPRGPHSALGANANLCGLSRPATVKRTVVRDVRGRSLRRVVSVHVRVAHSAAMPTSIVAQNGAVVHRPTVLDIAGCPTSPPRG